MEKKEQQLLNQNLKHIYDGLLRDLNIYTPIYTSRHEGSLDLNTLLIQAIKWYKGIKCSRDIEKTRDILEQIISSPHQNTYEVSHAYYLLGLIDSTQNNNFNSRELSLEYFSKSAETNNPLAIAELGKFYYFSGEEQKSRELLEKATEMGNSKYIHLLLAIYKTSRYQNAPTQEIKQETTQKTAQNVSTQKTSQEKVKSTLTILSQIENKIQEALNREDTDSLISLSCYFNETNGPISDEKKQHMLLEKAGELGNGEAYSRLASLNMVESNTFLYHIKGAEYDHVPSIDWLGRFFQKEDIKKSIEWFKKAISIDFNYSIEELCKLYLRYPDQFLDYELEKKWLLKACCLDVRYANLAVSKVYMTHPNFKDEDKGWFYLSRELEHFNIRKSDIQEQYISHFTPENSTYICQELIIACSNLHKENKKLKEENKKIKLEKSNPVPSHLELKKRKRNCKSEL